ncbi:MAG TPA: GNAT family N-acetyltransferase [Solirubrobacteraceae bacterium]|jgi:branched-chain amino acid aminotransferase|nr:GNAT family N-acetyltransferase [Solirubrobacteraceae bacterium]
MNSSASPRVQAPASSWVVRPATREDASGVVVAVQELLLELGGAPPPVAALRQTVRELIDDRDAGVVLVARSGGDIVGMLAASWQLAIHVPGRYATIQDLWVHPTWRSRSIGADLMTALVDLARQRNMARIEVGLPRESFRAIDATEAFYRNNDFQTLGPRMRRLLA